MHPLPWTKFSYDEFLDDPAVERMTNEEVGAYIRLLRAAWKSGGTIPDDDEYLSSVTRMGPEWPGHREAIARAWACDRGAWVQKRIVREYAEYNARKEMHAFNGSVGAAKRWGGHSQAIANDGRSRLINRKEEDSKTLESEPAFSQKAQVNGLVKDLSLHLGGKS